MRRQLELEPHINWRTMPSISVQRLMDNMKECMIWLGMLNKTNLAKVILPVRERLNANQPSSFLFSLSMMKWKRVWVEPECLTRFPRYIPRSALEYKNRSSAKKRWDNDVPFRTSLKADHELEATKSLIHTKVEQVR
ncbi:hypothetical protein V6N13_043041 [Hibiscus sabdariffa]